jgi:hypothetical protein
MSLLPSSPRDAPTCSGSRTLHPLLALSPAINALMAMFVWLVISSFLSNSISREERVPYSAWRQRGEELIQALKLHHSGNPLQRIKTYVHAPAISTSIPG